MAVVYQIGLILFIAVSVLGAALIFAWRDAGRSSGRHRKVARHSDWIRRGRRRRKPDGTGDRAY